jgi:hypothetical protein
LKKIKTQEKKMETNGSSIFTYMGEARQMILMADIACHAGRAGLKKGVQKLQKKST